jgi:hypothetical protein
MKMCHRLLPLFVLPLLAADFSCDGCNKSGGASVSPVAAPMAAVDPVVAKFLQENSLQGQVVLVEFGTVGCALSNAGLDAMIAWHGAKAFPGLSYVRLETSKDEQAVKDYFAGKAPPFPVVRDSEAVIGKALGAAAFPQFVLVDKFGRARYRGSLPEKAKLGQWTESLTAETADRGPDVALYGGEKLDVPRLLASTKLPDLAGAVKPLGEYRGTSGLMLVFVDTSCPFAGTSIKDMPVVSAVLAGKNIPCVLVNIDDSADTVKTFYKNRKIGAAVVYDITADTKLVWNIQSVPTVVMISADNAIAYSGPAVWADLAAATTKMLGLPEGAVQFTAKGTGFG